MPTFYPPVPGTPELALSEVEGFAPVFRALTWVEGRSSRIRVRFLFPISRRIAWRRLPVRRSAAGIYARDAYANWSQFVTGSEQPAQTNEKHTATTCHPDRSGGTLRFVIAAPCQKPPFLISGIPSQEIIFRSGPAIQSHHPTKQGPRAKRTYNHATTSFQRFCL